MFCRINNGVVYVFCARRSLLISTAWFMCFCARRSPLRIKRDFCILQNYRVLGDDIHFTSSFHATQLVPFVPRFCRFRFIWQFFLRSLRLWSVCASWALVRYILPRTTGEQLYNAWVPCRSSMLFLRNWQKMWSFCVYIIGITGRIKSVFANTHNMQNIALRPLRTSFAGTSFYLLEENKKFFFFSSEAKHINAVSNDFSKGFI